MKPEISEIHVLFNGERGGYDLTILFWDGDGIFDFKEIKSHHLFIQGVEETIRDFRIKHNL
jgi:hypothetical protein